MPNLADSFMCSNFATKLALCEHPLADSQLDTWEREFVQSMRTHFNERETQSDLGMPQWNPSVGQWNQLQMIAEKIR